MGNDSWHGRSKAATAADIFQILNEIGGPAIGTGDVVERLGVSRPTATSTLKRLEDRSLLASRQLGNGQFIWYPTVSESSETVSVFPDANTISVQNPSETTFETLRKVGRLRESASGSYLFQIRRQWLDAEEFESPSDLEDSLSNIIDFGNPLWNKLIEYYWGQTPVVMYNESQEVVVIETQTADAMDSIRQDLKEEYIIDSSEPTKTKITNNSSVQAINAIHLSYPVQDNRRNLTEESAMVQKVANNAGGDLPWQPLFIGIDTDNRVHTFDRGTLGISIVDADSLTVIEEEQISGEKNMGGVLEKWGKYVEKELSGWSIHYRTQ